MRNIGLFVDVASLYFAVKCKFGEGRKVDYSKLLTSVVTDDDTFLFTSKAYVLTHSNANPSKFLAALMHAGYDITQKTPRFIKKEKVTVTRNDNFDSQITIDVLRHLNQLSEVVLCVNSENLLPLVEAIKQDGRRVTIYSCGIPNVLKTAANSYIEITEDILLS